MPSRKRDTVKRSSPLRMLCILSAFWVATAIGALAQSYTLDTLVNFTQTNGSGPLYSTLAQDSSGNLYGTTEQGGTGPYGGTYGGGTVFEISPAGVLTTLHNFCSQVNCTDGYLPYSGLILASNGNFYGTAAIGGTYYAGTVFQITPSGVLTTLHNFTGGDGNIPVGLIQATNGNLYGTTVYGGATNSYGTVFQITTGGTLTTLHSFAATDGINPYGRLVQASDGNLYGTTNVGGVYGLGTVFKITTGGTFTVLHSFSITDGGNPSGGLVQATNGNLYGATYSGGANLTYGTIFEITTAGTLTVLHNFDGKDGGNAYASMVLGTDGNLYGTALFGAYGVGTVFEITTGGTLTTLHSFDYTDGIYPESPLLQGTDGSFYGTTSEGASGYGTVFKLSIKPATINHHPIGCSSIKCV